MGQEGSLDKVACARRARREGRPACLGMGTGEQARSPPEEPAQTHGGEGQAPSKKTAAPRGPRTKRQKDLGAEGQKAPQGGNVLGQRGRAMPRGHRLGERGRQRGVPAPGERVRQRGAPGLGERALKRGRTGEEGRAVIDKLEMFIALARERHFGRAAEACGVAQPRSPRRSVSSRTSSACSSSSAARAFRA